jgi:glycerol-3-phosphate acyltransferase PlsY
MKWSLCLIATVIAAYLLGSINFAVILTHVLHKTDIRKVGTHNPGTANIGRYLGRGWGALVLLLDIGKGLAPLFLARKYLFTGNDYADYFALFLCGMAAILGHCRPLYYHFKGGGGLATSIGVFSFFVPVEFFCAMLTAFLIARIFFRHLGFSISQITPLLFIILTPVFVILSDLLFHLHISGRITLGSHPWYVVTGVIVLSAYIAWLNAGIGVKRLKELIIKNK